ncbi:MAG: Fe-S-cluster-containing hydrogenase subunit [Chloroflexi bacterium CSP1-4]|nr:MAG: Fe-S-cluster-containing hydrogenase subunit [Chloroflexi bacterium CSP1-4]
MCPPTGEVDDGPEMDLEESERATADRDVDPGEAIPPYAVTDGSQFGRRRFLRVLGLGTLAVVPLPILPELMRAAGLAEGQPEPVHGIGEPARTRDGRIRQWTMIIDLRSCDGCQSVGQPPRCTAACIEGHFAPEPMEWIEVYEADLPGGGTQFIPTPCQQCQNPPCVNVCPVGATFSTPEGTVLIDQDRCIGCRICMAACPYDRRFFNWGDAPIPPEALLADYSPEHQVPAKKGTVMKCDFCPDMARTGTLPYCVQGCPNRAIYYGDLEEDVATNGRVVVSASRFLAENDAYRLKEDLGTKPRVYYIPGHGEAVGRDVFTPDRQPTEWPWMEWAEGAVTWQR